MNISIYVLINRALFIMILEPVTKSSRKKNIKEEKSDKKGKKKTQISAKDYEDATQLLATRLYNVVCIKFTVFFF